MPLEISQFTTLLMSFTETPLLTNLYQLKSVFWW